MALCNITIGRLDSDDTAQGVVRPADGSWQLVIDAEGYPHLYVRVRDAAGNVGLFAVEAMLPDGMTTKDLMLGEFSGEVTPEDEAEAKRELEGRGIPWPR